MSTFNDDQALDWNGKQRRKWAAPSLQGFQHLCALTGLGLPQ